MADALATLSSMFQVNHWNHVPVIKVQRLDRPSHVFVISGVTVQTNADIVDNRPWYCDIKQFLQSREYPPNASNKDKKTLRRLASKFVLDGDVLYKRNFVTPSLII